MCFCNGSDNDCNTMKSIECKGEVVGIKCTKKLINNKLELAIQQLPNDIFYFFCNAVPKSILSYHVIIQN